MSLSSQIPDDDQIMDSSFFSTKVEEMSGLTFSADVNASPYRGHYFPAGGFLNKSLSLSACS